MSKVNYATEIGDYNDDVRVSIDLRIKDGLSKDDYEVLRVALNTIEDIAYKYKEDSSKEES